ncbi:MAG: T9SS type A sorting domain-containing protein [Bacteroidetes bacterium]|nr:T9SS type A sorting domain-containing protein [Bacteroidota bacterium]MBU1116472.1 T9SS type A sorting domain-containing protein [Bacteroidota bacterium]MBU1797293.1 T9SS type A sorting domain-containing protein [Bacteroidota bacterium]
MKNIIIVLIFSANFLFAQDGFWEISGRMANPIAGGNAVYYDGSIYISGGYSKETQSNVSWIQKYNPFNGSTEIIANMKIPRYGHESVIVNGKLYFVGGVNESSDINTRLEELDIAKPDTTVLLDSNSNFNRIFSTGVTNNNYLYLIGGNSYSNLDSNKLSYIVEYDMINDSISYKFNEADSAQEFPEQQMSAIYGNDIYIFGGVSNGVLRSIQKFNMQTHTLDTLEVELFEPRAGGAAVRNGYTNEIYIIGGFNEGNSALRSVEVLSIYGDNYYVNYGPELNEARTNLMAVSTDFDVLYVLGGYNENGEVLSSIEIMSSSMVGQKDEMQPPTTFRLEQNYPNPFNPSTTIKYSIPRTTEYYSVQRTTLKVYDILGSEIATLVNKYQSAGNYEVKFDAGNLTSGIYFYTINSGSYFATKKMTVLK